MFGVAFFVYCRWTFFQVVVQDTRIRTWMLLETKIDFSFAFTSGHVVLAHHHISFSSPVVCSAAKDNCLRFLRT